MIELTNFKATDTVGQLRRQINTMQNEIMADQPFIGAPVNPSINYYKQEEIKASLVATSTASTVKHNLMALCFPENNGVFVAAVWGNVYLTSAPQYVVPGTQFDTVIIDIPAIKLTTRDTSISTFVSCEHLGLKNLIAQDIPATAEILALQNIAKKPVTNNPAYIEFNYNADENRSLTFPFIEQGDNTCNLIFSFKLIN